MPIRKQICLDERTSFITRIDMTKHTPRNLSLICLALSLLVGCATQDGLNSAPTAPAANIEMFRDGQKPTKPYKELGMLTDDGGLKEQPEIEAQFIKKAKQMGGNAIILEPLVKTGGEVKPFTIHWTDTYLYKAIVIRCE